MHEVAAQLCALMADAWIAVDTNEFGVLLMQQQLLNVQQVLRECCPTLPRHLFWRAVQMVQVLSVESLPELYSLVMPIPELTADDVKRLVTNHAGLRSLTASAPIQWERLPLKE